MNPVKPPPAITAALTKETFDQLWEAFDQKYAMFRLRPEVDWAKLREQHRPKALASKSTYEFAGRSAREPLKNLRDLHIWLKVGGAYVPVFNRPRSANANPEAYETIVGGLKKEGRVAWAVTTNNTSASLPFTDGTILKRFRHSAVTALEAYAQHARG